MNNNITLPITVAVQIDLYLKPLDVRLTPRKVSLPAGRRIEIRCESSGSRPPARMSWFVNSEPLANHTDLLSIDGNRTTSVLAFWPSRSDHGRYLRCRTENFLLSDSALEDGWRLNITYTPQVTLTLRSSSKQQRSFLEGDDVRFSCDIRANPEANEVGWLFEGKPLDSDADPEVVPSFRSLLVRRVKRKHRGKYQCYASNAEGTGISRIIHLRAMYAPVCRDGQQTTYAVAADNLKQIECQVDADPPSVEFRWSFSNAVDRHYNVSFSSSRLLSVASYLPKTPRDYGTLYCWGKNSVGEQQMPCIFTIIPVGPPETLQNCSYTNVTTASVSIVCVGRGPRQDLQYNLELFIHQSRRMVLQKSSPTPSFVVENLTPGTEFLFEVYAVNSNGRSTAKRLTVCTLRSPTEERVFRENGNDDDNPKTPRWLGAALVAGAALCFFLLFTSAALWTRFKGGPGCQKCKELPKKFNFTSFSTQDKTNNKNYIDRMPEGYEKRTSCI